MRLNEVLFPTDFSAASGVLHLLHVVPPVTDPSLAAETLARVARSFGDGLRMEREAERPARRGSAV
jgi:hypothetical protein